MFAYFWVLFIISWWTPNEVTVLEALLTFLFFFLMVIIAYVVERRESASQAELEGKKAQNEDDTFAEMEVVVRRKYGKNMRLTTNQASLLMAYEFPNAVNNARVAF